MATYTDVSSFKRDFYPDRDDVDPRFLARAAAMSYNYVNSKLGRFYSVPFAQVSSAYPPIIVDASDMITRALANYIIKKSGLPKVTQLIDKDNPFDPITILDNICMGALDIYDADGDLVARLSGTDAWTNIAGRLRIFDRDHEFNHEISETDLDNIDNDREAH